MSSLTKYKHFTQTEKDYLDRNSYMFYRKIRDLLNDSKLFNPSDSHFKSKEMVVSNYCRIEKKMRDTPRKYHRIEIRFNKYDESIGANILDVSIEISFRLEFTDDSFWGKLTQKKVYDLSCVRYSLFHGYRNEAVKYSNFMHGINEYVKEKEGEFSFTTAEKKLIKGIYDIIDKTIEEILSLKSKMDEKVSQSKAQEVKELSNQKNKIIDDLDSDGNGIIDIIEGDDDFMKLFQKHQDVITKLDKTYVHNFVKLSNYLGKKRDNIQTIFTSIKKVNNESQLLEEVGILKNQIHTYKSLLFHSLTMVISVVENDLITFYQIYETLDKLNIFNSNWENELSQKISDVNSNLESVNENLRQVSQGLLGLMYSIQKMELSILDEMNNLTYVTQEGFSNLENSLSTELQSIDSSLRANNLLSGIQAYQLYKINKQTKGLSN